MAYARGTVVSPEKSRSEIEEMLRKAGATHFGSGWEPMSATIGFALNGRRIRFVLPLPSADDKQFRPKRLSYRYGRPAATSEKLHEAEVRRRWRALALAIKAKLEVVASGIASFESEFLAHVVMPDGKTVGEHVSPQIATAYETGRMPALLPAPGETS